MKAIQAFDEIVRLNNLTYTVPSQLRVTRHYISKEMPDCFFAFLYDGNAIFRTGKRGNLQNFSLFRRFLWRTIDDTIPSRNFDVFVLFKELYIGERENRKRLMLLLERMKRIGDETNRYYLYENKKLTEMKRDDFFNQLEVFFENISIEKWAQE